MTLLVARDSVPTTAERPAVAWAPVGGLAAALVVLLVALAGRYGYHRDELYFLRAGREAAIGYVDQPPLTPLVARAVDALVPGSLTALRVPSALTAGAVVLLTGLLARELGGRRRAQVLAAASMAVSGLLLTVGHLLSTTTFDLLCWTALSWLLVRALRDGGPGWLAAGAVAGVGLENKWQPAFLVAGVLIGVLVAGPRRALASPWPWLGGLLAAALWLPNLVWQAAHGWPQLEMASALAAGSSGSGQPWYLFLPFQLLLISPLLVPVWAAGLWRLARDPGLRTWRAFAVAYVVLAASFFATGGKPYYLGGLYPVLLAAGAEPVTRWAAHGAGRVRRVAPAAAVVLTLAVTALISLPVLPADRLAATPIMAVNYDAGETVGWSTLAAAVRRARAQLPASGPTVVLTVNYGEAGAVDRYAPDLGPAYSGHNSYADWGPPPETATSAVVVGYPREVLQRWFGRVALAGRVDNGVGLDNDEQGTPIWIASERLRPWPEVWRQVRHLG